MTNVCRRWLIPAALGAVLLAGALGVDAVLRAPIFVPSDIADPSAANAHLAWMVVAGGAVALVLARLAALSIGRPVRERIGASVACLALVVAAAITLSFTGVPLPQFSRSTKRVALDARVDSWQPPFGRARNDVSCGDRERVGPSTTVSIECVRAGGKWDEQWMENSEIPQVDGPPMHLVRVCGSPPEMDLPCHFTLARSFTQGFLKNARRLPEGQLVSPLAPLFVRHDYLRGVWQVTAGRTEATADADDVRPTWLFDRRLAPIDREVRAIDTFPVDHVLPWWWGAGLLGSATLGGVLLFLCLRGRPGRRAFSIPYLGLLALVAALPMPLGVAAAVNAATWQLLATKGHVEDAALATEPNECDAPMKVTGTESATISEALCLDPRPVTRAAYDACAMHGDCPAARADPLAETCLLKADMGPLAPMSCLDQVDAEAYCRSRGARLIRSKELRYAHDLEEPELRFGFCNLGSCWTPTTPDAQELTEDMAPSVVDIAPHTYFRCAK